MTCHSTGRSADRHHRLGQATSGPVRMRIPSPPQKRTTFIVVSLPRRSRARAAATTSCAPHSRTYSSCAAISLRAGSTAGSRCSPAAPARAAPASKIGMCVPGRNMPCLNGLRSTVNASRSALHAAVVEQGVALARRAVRRPRACPRREQSDEELDEVVAHLARPTPRTRRGPRACADRRPPRRPAPWPPRRSARAPASVGIDQVRSDPPWVGSSSTSTTVRPAVASTRWVVSSDR